MVSLSKISNSCRRYNFLSYKFILIPYILATTILDGFSALKVNEEIKGRYPIHYAADFGQLKVLELLILKGADVNKLSYLVNYLIYCYPYML
ncbi:uncharacterized protein LOC108163919 isoform X3 [Drosophila miranda]|uniref:uncharacterized protein LOC108163919 isoform X3 n=1 Tax=Drosophila miranda TaxID=7229 RepID=UPI00143F4142|nr:uncharacterized protein LOC108163919 isoform X3 [Drosophila miranda]